MDQARLPKDLKDAVSFHGHLCPGLMIGWRAAKAAAKWLGVESSGDEELVTIAENDSCSVDAFQFLLSTTFGKGNLVFKDHGKQVFTVISRDQNRAVRVSFTGDKLKKTGPEGATDRQAFIEALLTAPDEDVVSLREVEPDPPSRAKIEPGVPCARCAEPTQKSKMAVIGDNRYCRPCAVEMAS